jgi:glycosyltransferase involved in cell wall biosynthesis
LNEAANLPFVLPHLPDFVTEVIVVDARSEDDTIEVAIRLRPDVVVMIQEGRGKGAALRQGFEAATGDIIVSIDADGSTNPNEIPSFVAELVAGADYVKGSRFVPGGGTSDMSRLRRAGNHGLTMMVRVLHGARYTDLCYGYNAFWSYVLPHLALESTGFEIETEMNIRAHTRGFRVAEVPSFEEDRIHGKSNLRTFPDGWRVLKTILRELRRPDVGTVPVGPRPVRIEPREPIPVLVEIEPEPSAQRADDDRLVSVR